MPGKNNTSPQLLSFYTLCILYIFLPRILSHLHISTTTSLLLHLLISGSTFSTAIVLLIDTCYTFSRLSFLLLSWILQKTSSLNLKEEFQQCELPGSDNTRFWVKVGVSVVVGYTLTIKLILFNEKKIDSGSGEGVWETAKRNIGQTHHATTQSLTQTEQQDKVVKKLPDNGSALLWAYCAFVYTVALFDSKEWLESLVSGDVQKERAREWDMWCLWGPSLISGAVGFGRWRWIVMMRKRKVLLHEERHIDGKEVTEKQQV
jgi:hypothetical protein